MLRGKHKRRWRRPACVGFGMCGFPHTRSTIRPECVVFLTPETHGTRIMRFSLHQEHMARAGSVDLFPSQRLTKYIHSIDGMNLRFSHHACSEGWSVGWVKTKFCAKWNSLTKLIQQFGFLDEMKFLKRRWCRVGFRVRLGFRVCVVNGFV